MEISISKVLLQKYLKGQCSPEEKAIVETWYIHISGQQLDSLDEPDYAELRKTIFNAITLGEQEQSVKVKRIWLQTTSAAAIVLMLISTVFLFINHKQVKSRQLAHDISPGGNNAILTLADGKQISLDSAKKGKIASQESVLINKTSDGLIDYEPEAVGQGKISYNLITTPRAGQYALILADGTRVTLNAASSIKFPVQFIGNNRLVEITGEAYFEVAHNKDKPFIVVSNGQQIEVLGTHFNVNAYPDEPGTTTTLLEGMIKISTKYAVKLVKPGQQAYLVKNQINVSAANVSEAVAWKNGYFRFNNDNIESIMRKLSRWYNIDVSYDGPPSNVGFYGRISRFKNISQVLHLLEKTNGVHFDIHERRIIVKN